MLVGHDAVEAHLVSQRVLVVVLVVQDVRLLRVEKGVWEAEPAGLVLLQVGLGDMGVGLLGKPENLNFVFHRSGSWEFA